MDAGDTGLDGLFEDLEQQAAGLELSERDAELADRARGEYAAVALADRVHASRGLVVELLLHGGEVVEGVLTDAGRGWCRVETPAGAAWLVRLAAVAVLRGMSPRALPEAARPAVARLGFGSALHRLVDGSGEACLHLTTGAPYPVRVLRVGADFVEVARDRPAAAAGPELVALDAVRAVRVG